MTERKKQWLLRILMGGMLGAVTVPFISRCLLSMQYLEKPLVGLEQFVFPAMVQAFGSLGVALAVQSLLGAIFGAVVCIATLPFAKEGKSLLRQSVIHFAATALAFSALLYGCRWITTFWVVLAWVGILAVLYLIIWLVRWIGWWQEVRQMRTLLGLEAGPSPLRWKETLPYLPFLLLICNIMPSVLMWVDLTFIVDVPIFSGIIYPFFAMPIIGFCSGFSLGKRQGLCWLYPIACFLFYLPMVFLIYNSSAMFHCFMIAVPALVGMLFGWIVWRRENVKTNR